MYLTDGKKSFDPSPFPRIAQTERRRDDRTDGGIRTVVEADRTAARKSRSCSRADREKGGHYSRAREKGLRIGINAHVKIDTPALTADGAVVRDRR